jgi:hypothetical protein
MEGADEHLREEAGFRIIEKSRQMRKVEDVVRILLPRQDEKCP